MEFIFGFPFNLCWLILVFCFFMNISVSNDLLSIKDEDGNKMVNEYVHLYKIGSGSYGKVVSLLILIRHWLLKLTGI